MPATTHFAENISRLAGMYGLTQSQLAKALGVAPQTVSLWRSGRQPSTSVIVRASQIFQLPAERLFSAEFAELLPLMAEPDQYRAVEKNIHRALHGIKKV
jgi:transcriptional regulator with XRE-family HTH domain